MFQFYCPNGHLLQGQESQSGQQSQCPMCGAMFIVPALNPGPSAAPPQQPAPPAQQPAAPAPPPAQQPAAKQQAAQKPAAPAKPPEPEVYHIPCPNGHVLETPADLIGQAALCPYCNVQFDLRAEDSQEHRRELEELRRQREIEMNERWVRYSINLAIGVGIMFLLMLLWQFGIRMLFAAYLEGTNPIWGVLGSAVLAMLITLIIASRGGRKKRKAE